MKLPRLNGIRRQVGVVGLYRAGKTVFLTSLINHLQKHDPRRMPIGKGDVQISFGAELPPENGFERFPYLEYRNGLSERHAWPVKTRATAQYHCQYFRSDWRMSRGELSLLDFAGERLADLPMASMDYAAWSDLILTIFREHGEYRSLAQPYLDLLESAAPEEAAVVDAYRRTLGELFKHFRPVVSPSTFILRNDGGWVGDRPADRMFDESYAGLGPASQFAPLPERLRQGAPHLTSAFARRYDDYRAAVAVPLAGWMRGCDTLLVLVDVTTLLAGGLGMYEGNRELLRNAVQFLKPGRGLWGMALEGLHKVAGVANLASPLQRLISRVAPLQWGRINRVGFVATKADKVHESQRANLQHLLKDMVHDLVAGYVADSLSLDVHYFVTAAVNSTQSTPDGRLQAYLRSGDTVPEVFTPSPVPSEWPGDWPTGQFRYPNVAPWMPARRDAPPNHLGLNQVVDFVLK